jgi:hypothetical protein
MIGVLSVFKVGDEVVWIMEALHHKVGIVTDVIPNDSELNEFTLYGVDFDFGLRTLHGSHSCNKKFRERRQAGASGGQRSLISRLSLQKE